MGKVIDLYSGVADERGAAEKVLNNALGELDSVIIIGSRNDGAFYWDSTTDDGGELLWLIEQFKFRLLRGDFR